MRRIISKRHLLTYLTEYIIMSLNELNEILTLSDFAEGELLAYVECLEILSKWKGFKKYGIEDIEKHFNVT